MAHQGVIQCQFYQYKKDQNYYRSDSFCQSNTKYKTAKIRWVTYSLGQKWITTLTIKIDQGRMCTCQSKPMHDLPFDGKSNNLPISHHFQDIYCGNVHDLDLDLYNGPRSNVNMLNESPCMTCHLMAIVIFYLFLIISKIFVVEMCMTLTLTLRAGQGQM